MVARSARRDEARRLMARALAPDAYGGIVLHQQGDPASFMFGAGVSDKALELPQPAQFQLFLCGCGPTCLVFMKKANENGHSQE